ncbi:MAG TPA: ABC transporter permease [Blastocatellia bacterium]|jgi:predicted permease|nr:ABC transporter permease [Blastocatellia bacterium]
MPLLPRLSSLWRNLFQKARKDQELTEEIDAYLEMLVEQKINEGLNQAEARRAALIELGGREQVKEKVREARAGYQLDTLWQDLRYALRMLRRNPGFAAVAVLTLALGIGANTAIFSVANTLLLRPFPIKDADRIVDLRRSFHPRWEGFSYPDYLELRKRSGAVADLFAFSDAELALGASDVGSKATVDNEAEELHGLLVTGTFFSSLGGNAALGRTLTPDDDQADGAHPVVVLSHRFWQRRFGAAPDIVGQSILLNGRAFTVVGVAEADFTGAGTGKPDVWAPLLMRDQLNPKDKLHTRLDDLWLHVRGRLQPGVELQQAEATMAMAFSQIEQDNPSFASGHIKGIVRVTINENDPEKRPSFAPAPRPRIKLYPVTLASMEGPEMIQSLTTIMSVALGAVTLVLLIACLNVAGLTLARLASRQREIAVRLSLGASRARLLRQLFTESLLLAVVGGLAGLLLSHWMAQALSFVAYNPPGGIALDWRVMAYTLGISVLTAVVIGLTPAWQTTRFDLIPALKQEGTGFNLRAPRFPLRSLLVVGQIALSLVLLLGAGLVARTLLSVVKLDPGFETKNLSIAQIRYNSPGSSDYDETRAAQFQRELQERLLATPPVIDAVWVGHVPLMDEPFDPDPGDASYYLDDGSASIGEVNGVTVITARTPPIRATSNAVEPSYFAALGVPLLSGRTFTEEDTRDDKAVVVVNEALARRHWPGESPLGKSLLTRGRKWEIVGVAKNTRNNLFYAANEPYLYLPLHRTEGRFGLWLLVRSEGDPSALAATLRTTVQSLDPKLKIQVRQFEDVLKHPFEPLLTGASLAGLAGLLALALAVMGLYGVTAFVVVQRTHEIGVRMALGARAADVVRLVLRQGLRLVIIGVALGLPISAAVTRVLAAALFGISPTDPLTFGATSLLLSLVALIACWIPARRATKVDPLDALRHE